MRIQSISNNYMKQGFRGLWGKTTMDPPDIDETLGVNTVRINSYYYPYLDEPRDEISKVLSENISANLETPQGQKPKYVVRQCIECSPLKFTRDAFLAYHMAKDPSLDVSDIHEAVKDKYINPQYEQQQSASNSIFDKPAVSVAPFDMLV